MQAVAVAQPNIAVVKYWGKRHSERNLPAVGSIGLTLDRLETRTRVRFFFGEPGADAFRLNDRPASEAERLRVSRFLDLVRQRAGCSGRAEVESRNTVPTGAGLASSSAGFAALALAATRAAGLELAPAELSALARVGSGSAARAVCGGFCELHAGCAETGCDAVAEPLPAPPDWPLRVLVVVVSASVKSVGSSAGMLQSAATSPFYAAWIDGAAADLAEARAAIAAGDLARLGPLAEHNCLKMHGVMLATRPALIYWNGTTLDVLHEVARLRRSGLRAFFTVDAGPQVKVLCLASEEAAVAESLRRVAGVRDVLACGPGPAARLVSEAP